MRGPEPDERAPLHLLAVLGAAHRSQSLLLVEFDQTCQGDLLFLPAFRRWNELLSGLRLHLLRAEGRLLHLAPLARSPGPPRIPQLPAVDQEVLHRTWTQRFTTWFAEVRLDPTYHHLESVLDPDAEPVLADIITDLALVAETAEASMPALAALEKITRAEVVEEMAFFQVIAPWRRRGHPALLHVLRWLDEMLVEHGDW